MGFVMNCPAEKKETTFDLIAQLESTEFLIVWWKVILFSRVTNWMRDIKELVRQFYPLARGICFPRRK